MENKYSKCQKCPAFHLLSEERKEKIDKWENKRDHYLSRMKIIRLILLGESLPANKYFYDIQTDYENRGLRYTLKKEFKKLEISDSLFLESMVRKGIILFDCALCPLYLLSNSALRRKAATYCLLSINYKLLNEHPNIPISTIFPANLGVLKKEIPLTITSSLIGEFSFSDQTGLSQLYEKIKTTNL